MLEAHEYATRNKRKEKEEKEMIAMANATYIVWTVLMCIQCSWNGVCTQFRIPISW